MGFRPLSCQATTPPFCNPRTHQGKPGATECARPAKFFQQTVPRRVSISTIRQIFEQCRQFLNSRGAIMLPRPSSNKMMATSVRVRHLGACRVSNPLMLVLGRGGYYETVEILGWSARMARHDRGACPSRRGGITSEKRSQTPQPAAARRVVPLFALSGVAPHSQTHKGYAPSSRLTQTKNPAATRAIPLFQQSLRRRALLPSKPPFQWIAQESRRGPEPVLSRGAGR